jgi:toxin-antitoxin system PIN domain toxin
VKVIDLNLLLYAYNSAAQEHPVASLWLNKLLVGHEPLGFSWVTVLGFLRIVTTPRVLANPKNLGEAAEIVSDWLDRDSVSIISPTDHHWSVLSDLLAKSRARGALIMDAHLAALAIEHGATLCTNDRDFLRFPGLKVEFPLQ